MSACLECTDSRGARWAGAELFREINSCFLKNPQTSAVYLTQNQGLYQVFTLWKGVLQFYTSSAS